MGDSQQTSPAQAQAGPTMRCCQKTDIRDCDCLRPRGPCQKPTNIFTHYDHQCKCYSCEWIREATQEYVPDRLGSGSNPSGTIKNCTYAGKQLDEVVSTEKTQVPVDLDLVHPIMAAEGPPQQWKWVFRSTNQEQIPYLAGEDQCPKTVMMATMDSNGRWKGIRANEECFRLVHTLPPMSNRLYRDYGYSLGYSPYGGDSREKARKSDKMACTPDPMVPTNKLRRYGADESNTTLVVGSIDKSVSKEDLQWLFGCYGQIRYINRPDQTCAFIQFALRRDAMMAMRQLQGVPIYRGRFRISWGDPRVRNQDEFEAREGPLRLKGTRHQKPHKPRGMEPEREGSKPPLRLDPHAAPFTPEQKGKGRVVVVSSDCVANPSGQSHNQPPQDTRTPSPESRKTGDKSSSNSSNRATNGSNSSGHTSPPEDIGPDEEGRK